MPAKKIDATDLHVRLPRDLYDDLLAATAAHEVSLNTQIVTALRMGLLAEAAVDEQVAALMPVLGPRVAQAIREQNAAERARRTARTGES